MRTRIHRALPAFIAIAVLALALWGCSDSPNEPAKARAPELPPAESMRLDLSAFSPEDVGPAPKSQFKFNFWNAQIRVAILNVAVAMVVAPPAAAIDAATHSIPSLQPDGAWIWTYTYVNGEEEVVLRLRAIREDEAVLWQMFVTALGEDPPIDRVLWFEGRTRGQDNGEWTLHDFTKPGDPAVLHIDWEVDADNDRFLTFEIINPGQPEYGDRLMFSDVGTLASILLEDASSGDEWDIRWDQSTGTGSLKVPDYNNGERACWDEHQDDVACPA
jgi:hypothetical protein